MALKRISELTAGTPPYADDSLVEVSVPTGGSPSHVSRKVELGDLLPLTSDPEILALAGLVSAADRLPYFTGSATAALATFTAAGRALVDDADAAAQRTTLGLAAIASSGVSTDLSDSAALARLASPTFTGTPTIPGAILSTAPTLTGFTAGSVLFAGASGVLSQDSANLFWDDTNNRLGIGNIIPAVTLDVGATASALRVRNLFTDASNGEWFEAAWASNVLSLGTNQNGTGVARSVRIVQGGVCVLGHPNGGADTTSWSSGPRALFTQNANNLYNTAFGADALFSNTTGASNIAIGLAALYDNTTGAGNLAFGSAALSNNTTGPQNTAIGANALLSNTTGGYSIAIGAGALYSSLTADGNIAIGGDALYSNTTGAGNLAIGSGSLNSNVSGSMNVAIGPSANRSNTTGSTNTSLGSSALYSNTTGIENVAVGSNALYNNTTGGSNVAIGTYALFNLNILDGTGGNVAVGHNTGGGIATGINNTIIGANVSGLAAGLSSAIILATGDGSIKLDYGKTTAGTWTIIGPLSGVEQAAPAAPAANGYHIFAQDNGSGKTQLMAIFGSGVAQQIAIEP